MVFVIDDPDQQARLFAARADAVLDSTKWADFYGAAYDIITVYTEELVPGEPPITHASPIVGVDPAAWLWLRGAINVNSGGGTFGQYIRDYTKLQYKYRSGDELSDQAFQDASNIIARRFADDLVDGTVGNLQWHFPTLDRIGTHDAGAAAAEVFTGSASSTGAPNPSAWAGTVLFASLGDPSYFTNWILALDGDRPSTTVGDEVRYDKQETGAYDLFAAAQVTLETKTGWAAFQTLISAYEMETLTWVNLVGGSATSAAWAAADDFMADTYGESAAQQYLVGKAIFDNVYGATTDFGFRIGTVKDDTGESAVRGTTYDEGIHAGAGDDEIIASAGSDLIDGGDGTDLLTYDPDLSNLNLRLRVAFDEQGHWGWRTTIEKIPGGGGPVRLDVAYNIEELTLSPNSDTVTGGSGTTVPGAGLVIDMGDGADFSYGHTPGVTVNGAGGSDWLQGKGASGEAGDTIGGLLLGGDGADYLTGGAGDTIDGGAGNDVLQLDAGYAATVIFGRGSGHDVLLPAPYWDVGWESVPSFKVKLEGLSRGNVELVWQLEWDTAGTDETVNEDGFIPYVGGRGGAAALRIADTGDTLYLGKLSFMFGGWTTPAEEHVYENDTVEALQVGYGWEVKPGRPSGDIDESAKFRFDLFQFDDGSTASLSELFDLRHMESADIDPSWTSAQDEFEAGMAADGIGATGEQGAEGTNGNDVVFAYFPYGSVVSSGDGDDSVTAVAGDDYLEGGSGHDRLDGGAGRDTAGYAGDAGPGGIVSNLTAAGIEVGGVTVGAGQVRDGGGGMDTLVSIEVVVGSAVADSLFGSDAGDELYGGGGGDLILGQDGDDEISGEDGDDTLGGGAGADILLGGVGADIVAGGAGADHVLFFAPNEGGDHVSDFTVGEDRILVSAYGFGGGLWDGMDLTGWFTTSAAGTADVAGHGQFILRPADPLIEGDRDSFWWDEDGADPGAPVLLAWLPAASGMTALDISVIT